MANIDDPSLHMDQEIVLDSDRKMASYQSQPSPGGQPHSSTPSPTTQSALSPSAFGLSMAAHPLSCIFTVLFKALSLITYLLIGAFLPNVITFIAVLVLAALDFWVVKNVTGRHLVGLRWWNQYDAQGNEVWRFQSFDKEFQANSVDAMFFWTSQIAGTGIWGFFLLIKVLSLTLFWGILTCINFCLCGLNLYGYYRCRGDYKNKLNSLKASSLKTLAGRLFF